MVQDLVRSAASFGEMIMKMGCVVKGHFIEMPINQSLDIFMTKTIHQYEHFYKSGRKKSATYCWWKKFVKSFNIR